ncbi:MAG: GNAT family N-acetyltransferase [Thermoguttaceae bacterium]|jgi:ribosomal protein S18 acetylase RimI-like enzyme
MTQTPVNLVHIRPATARDADAITEVHLASMREAYRELLGADELARIDAQDRANRWREHLAGGGSTTLLAEANGRPVGFVDFGACRDDDLSGSVGEVMAVYVHPEAWGRRFGERLMREALEQLRSSDLDPVVLWIVEGNHRAIAFYERLAFAWDGAIRHHEMFGRAVTVVRLRRYSGAQTPGRLRGPD